MLLEQANPPTQRMAPAKDWRHKVPIDRYPAPVRAWTYMPG